MLAYLLLSKLNLMCNIVLCNISILTKTVSKDNTLKHSFTKYNIQSTGINYITQIERGKGSLFVKQTLWLGSLYTSLSRRFPNHFKRFPVNANRCLDFVKGMFLGLVDKNINEY